MTKKNTSPEYLERRRQQYRDSKRRQRANQKKGLEFTISLDETEHNFIKWINDRSEFKTKASVIRELLKEAKRRGQRYKTSTRVSAQDVEMIFGDPDHIDRYYESLKNK